MTETRQCWVCGTTGQLEEHHIFGGCRRATSEKYKLKVYLCRTHHTGDAGVHFNKRLMDKLHRYGQRRFEAEHPELDFLEVFGKNYLWEK